VVSLVNKRVYNKTFGKIVRTLGFLLVLASSIFLATKLVLQNTTLPFIDKLEPFATIADGYATSFPIIAEYAGLALVLGLILILWAIRKGLILRLVLTAVLLFGFIESSISGTSALVPIVLASPAWLDGVLSMVEGLVNQVTAMSPYVIPGVAVAKIMLYIVTYLLFIVGGLLGTLGAARQ